MNEIILLYVIVNKRLHKFSMNDITSLHSGFDINTNLQLTIVWETFVKIYKIYFFYFGRMDGSKVSNFLSIFINRLIAKFIFTGWINCVNFSVRVYRPLSSFQNWILDLLYGVFISQCWFLSLIAIILPSYLAC